MDHPTDCDNFVKTYVFCLQFTPLYNGERILKIGKVLTKLSPSVGGPLFWDKVLWNDNI